MFLNFCEPCAQYTLKKTCPKCQAVTRSAHPGNLITSALNLHCEARFSPDDKYSRQRVTLKERYNLLPTQQPPKEY